MNEKHLGYVTIAFVSLIFIAFFATEINKSPANVSEITGMATPSSGGGLDCWHEGANGREVYLMYLKLATANNQNADIDTLLQDNGYANMDALLQGLSSSDKNVVSDAQQVLDLISKRLSGDKKFDFNFQECIITCNYEQSDANACTQANGVRKDKMYKWIGDGATETKQTLVDPNRPIIKLFGAVTRENIKARKPNLEKIISNKDMMTATCYCAEIELGCCEEKGGLSFKNQGPLQAQWKRNPILDTETKEVCPAPNKWIPGVCPTSDPQRRPIGKC